VGGVSSYVDFIMNRFSFENQLQLMLCL